MIFNENAMPLMVKYQAAREVEAIATQALLSAMENGSRDMPALDALTQEMTDAHNKAMDIWDALQQHRIGS
jgi:hypothetical protein